MKTAIKFSSILVLFIMVASCATAPIAIPEKYGLDNSFEEVKQITAFTIRSYENIDKQSLILETTFNDNYLLVLQRPRFEVSFGKTSFDYQRPSLVAGHDRVVMNYDSGPQYYVIEKIYKLKGREQVTEVKELLKEK